MTRRRPLIHVLSSFVCIAVASSVCGADEGRLVTCDVCIYGGTSGGVTTAVQAARLGKSVVLIEPGQRLGGMSSGGLGMTDNGSTETISGLSREFYQRVYRFYTKPENSRFQKRDDYHAWLPKIWGVDGPRMEEIKAQFLFEPRAAKAVFDDMVREAGVQVIFGERLDLKSGVRKDGVRITRIVMESGREFAAKVFIDASYEGDLMAKAGVKYIVGREPNSLYNETLNGALPFPPAPFPKISPYVMAGDPKSGLLPRVEPKPPGPEVTKPALEPLPLLDLVKVGTQEFSTRTPPPGLKVDGDLGLLMSGLVNGQVVHRTKTRILETRATITPKGDYLLMFPEGDHYAKSKGGKINSMMVCRSTDHGKTWSAPAVAYDIPYGQHGFIPLIPKGTKRIYAFGTQPIPGKWTWEDGKRENAPIGYRWSDDDGHTWSEVKLIAPVNDPGFMGMSVMRMTETDAGTWLVGSHLADWSVKPFTTQQYLLRSEDQGRTWTVLPGARPKGWIAGGFNRMDEGRPLNLGGGRVLFMSRTPEGHLFTAWSRDDGKTWTEPSPSTLVHPDAPPMLFPLSDGRTLVAFHHNKVPVTGNGDLEDKAENMKVRSEIWVSTSTDEGHTWSEPRFMLANAVAPVHAVAGFNSQCSYLDAFTENGIMHLFMPHRWQQVLHLTIKESAFARLPTKAELASLPSACGTVVAAGVLQHVELRRFRAAEAKQGVAADAGYFYAIDNHTIGKYRKDNGDRAGGWEGPEDGDIKHLNSGIVLDGRLYCAHSNFPDLPEQSSVEIWDTATMKHAGRHQFTQPPGSLTWAVRRGDEWFACFAHYKKTSDPARSVVVKFDTQWQQLASWRFPAALVEKFAGNSSSGGAFGPGGHLFVTGHDARELYVLDLPETGSELLWRSTVPISTAGQAFAWDPSEVGVLYSVERKTREVVVSRISADVGGAEKAGKTTGRFESLFDGKSFTGWEQKGNWVIEDGAFYRKSSGGPLTYVVKPVPDDFELRFEWKVSKGCNSGVYYRPAQYEYQVLDNANSPYGENPRQAAASLFFCMAPSKDATKPLGEWNDGRVMCQGTVIQHWLNGEKVIDFDYTDPRWSKEVELLRIRGADLAARGGRLWLQDHGAPVWFRNIRLRTIPPGEKLERSAFTPMPVPPAALEKENERVRKMLEAKKKK